MLFVYTEPAAEADTLYTCGYKPPIPGQFCGMCTGIMHYRRFACTHTRNSPDGHGAGGTEGQIETEVVARLPGLYQVLEPREHLTRVQRLQHRHREPLLTQVLQGGPYMVYPLVNDEESVVRPLEHLGIRHQETAHGDKSAHDLYTDRSGFGTFQYCCQHGDALFGEGKHLSSARVITRGYHRM